MTHYREHPGPEITLDWYDGPLCTIRRIDFDATPGIPASVLCEVETFAAETHEERGVTMARVRLDRETLQAMIDAIDGKPVTDFFNHAIDPKAPYP